MFEQAVPVKNDPTSPAGFTGLDAVIEPTIETYQFLSPAALDSKFYEASIEYRISLYTPNGELITDWPVTGHGRSYSRFWGAGQSLGEATTIAMRDAAAAMIINFKHRPSVRKWLLRINESQDRGSVTNARRISTTG
jgi:hypothetical protein